MSYNGTVRCSYCRHTGHNLTTCPAMKEDYENALAKDAKNLDLSYYDRRAILSYERIQRKKQKRKVTKRRCSYCKEAGHNRTSCGIKKNDIELFYKAQKIAHARYVNAIKETGIYHGAMIDVEGFDKLNHGKRTAYMLRYPAKVSPILITRYRNVMDSHESKRANLSFYKLDFYTELEKAIYCEKSLFTRADRYFGSRGMYNEYGYSDEILNVSLHQVKHWATKKHSFGFHRLAKPAISNWTLHKAKGLDHPKILENLNLKIAPEYKGKRRYGLAKYVCYVVSAMMYDNTQQNGAPEKTIDEVSVSELINRTYERSIYTAEAERNAYLMEDLKLYVEAFT